MQKEMRDIMSGVADVPTIHVYRRGAWREVPAPHPDSEVIFRHNPEATLGSRGCTEDCSFCGVPITEGPLVTVPDFPVRPVLCDNNLSALPDEYQDYIIERYQSAGIALRDANSGFEPHTFTDEVYRRWKPLINAGGGPWRFGYDEMKERDRVLRVMKMLADEPQKRKRVYVLIGNEPFAECMSRIQEVIDNGCEPHVQPKLALNALDREPQPKYDWTTQRLKDVARWANGWVWKRAPFSEYDRHRKNVTSERYDEQQGLFV